MSVQPVWGACRRAALCFASAYCSLLMPPAVGQPLQRLDEITERGLPFIQNYHPREFGSDTIGTDNFTLLQHKGGSLVMANSQGVLFYNGVDWRLASPGCPRVVRSIATDTTGRIFVGANEELGYLAPDAAGKMQYVSLLSRLAAEDRAFGSIRQVLSTTEGVYFRAAKFVFRWDGKRMRKWKPGTSFTWAGVLNGKLYVQEAGRGLWVLERDELRLFSDDPVCRNMNLAFVYPLPDRKWLLATRNEGLYWFDGKKTTPLPGPADAFARANELNSGLWLPDGRIALASLKGGVLVLEPDGQVHQVIDQKGGLLSNTTFGLALDAQRGLWVGTNLGASRVELFSPSTQFNETNGLPGTVFTAAKYRGQLYVGTSTGLFALQSADTPGNPAFFKQITTYSDQVWEIYSDESSLLVAGGNATYQWVDGRFVPVAGYTFVDLKPSRRNPDILYCAGDGVFVLHRKRGVWRLAGKVPGVRGTDDIHGVVSDLNGDVWVATMHQGVLRLRFPDGNPLVAAGDSVGVPVVTAFTEARGIPEGLTRVYVIGSEVYARVGSQHGPVFRFDARKDAFVPDSQLGNRYGFPGQTVIPSPRVSGRDSLWFWTRTEGEKKAHWSLAVRQPNGSFRGRRYAPERVFADLSMLYAYPFGNVIWFMGREGLIRFDARQYTDASTPYLTRIERMAVGGDSVLYPAQLRQSARLPFSSRGVRFEFAAASYVREKENRFQYQLEGYDEEWSDWTKETHKEYTRLPEGSYVFRVRSQNVYGETGQEATYRFTVLPPWYRTWPLYGVYLLLAGGALYGLVRWRSAQLEAEKRELEGVVAQRTAELARTNAQLAEQSAQVAAKNAQLETQARVLETQAAALETQTRRLQELDGVKSRFFANISHEFRTPLTLILGNLQDKLDQLKQTGGEMLPVPGRELGVMHRNARRLLELINQLLDLSKLESGQLQLEPAPGDIVRFWRVQAASFASLADSRQIRFRVLLPAGPLYLRFDADKLEKIGVNLLSNAFKFTPDGGTVTMQVELPAGDALSQATTCLVRMRVHNSGAGIPAGQLNKVFDRFYQGSRHYSDRQGTGIGLALVKELVQLHGGRVYVESDALQGTRFVVELPLPVASPAEAAAREEAGEDTFTGAEALPGHPADPVPAAIPGDQEAAGTAPLPLLLIVEDNPDLRQYIRGHLEGQFRVLESENGREGLETAREQMPDLVISDLMMPDVDGLELCIRLKTDERTSHIPVILLTALATGESRIRGLETGADDYLTKPFDARELVTRVNNLIALRRRLRERFSREIRVQPSDIAVTSADEKFLERVMRVAEAHLGDPDFGPEQFSREMNVSRMQLHRKLTALTGQATGDFLRIMRLKRAAQLLLARAGNVSEVSYLVGFQNLPHFSKSFKEQFGISPSEYAAKAER